MKNAKKIADEIYIGNLHWKFALEIALEICIGNCIGNLHWKFALEIAKEICIGNLHWQLYWEIAEEICIGNCKRELQRKFALEICIGTCIEKFAEGNLHSLLSVGNLGVRTTYEYWRSRKQKISMEEFDNY